MGGKGSGNGVIYIIISKIKEKESMFLIEVE